MKNLVVYSYWSRWIRQSLHWDARLQKCRRRLTAVFAKIFGRSRNRALSFKPICYSSAVSCCCLKMICCRVARRRRSFRARETRARSSITSGQGAPKTCPVGGQILKYGTLHCNLSLREGKTEEIFTAENG